MKKRWRVAELSADVQYDQATYSFSKQRYLVSVAALAAVCYDRWITAVTTVRKTETSNVGSVGTWEHDEIQKSEDGEKYDRWYDPTISSNDRK